LIALLEEELDRRAMTNGTRATRFALAPGYLISHQRR